jgi:hypothetical protein
LSALAQRSDPCSIRAQTDTIPSATAARVSLVCASAKSKDRLKQTMDDRRAGQQE